MHGRALLLVFFAASSTTALAQDELGLGLDLTEPSTPAEFKPALAILGVVPVPASPEEAALLNSRAGSVNIALLPAAMQDEPFSRVMSEEDAKAALGADFEKLQKCVAVECLEEIAQKLDVDRVITGQLTQSGGETKLSLIGYDRGLKQLFNAEAESAEKAMKKQLRGFSGLGGKSQAQKDREFLSRTNGPVYALIGNLKTALGAIDVRSYEPDVEVSFNGRKAGRGNFVKYVAAGDYAVHAESPSVLPFDTKVTVESAKTAEVALTLVARPKANPAVTAAERPSNSSPIYTRPGLYVALAGAVALGVGAMLGSNAKGIERRATDGDGDGILDITRAEANNAKSSGMLGTILMGAGGAAVAGGVVWMFVAPGTASSKTVDGPVVEPEGSGGGFTVGVGGAF